MECQQGFHHCSFRKGCSCTPNDFGWNVVNRRLKSVCWNLMVPSTKFLSLFPWCITWRFFLSWIDKFFSTKAPFKIQKTSPKSLLHYIIWKKSIIIFFSTNQKRYPSKTQYFFLKFKIPSNSFSSFTSWFSFFQQTKHPLNGQPRSTNTDDVVVEFRDLQAKALEVAKAAARDIAEAMAQRKAWEGGEDGLGEDGGLGGWGEGEDCFFWRMEDVLCVYV